mgnify:CR=1 FL=1
MGDIKTNIANNICFYRKKNGLTQNQLAEQLGVKTTTVSTWERAASSPDIETLYVICKIFGVSLDDMYGINTEKINDFREPNYRDVISVYTRSRKNLSQEEKMRLARIILSDDDDDDEE